MQKIKNLKSEIWFFRRMGGLWSQFNTVHLTFASTSCLGDCIQCVGSLPQCNLPGLFGFPKCTMAFEKCKFNKPRPFRPGVIQLGESDCFWAHGEEVINGKIFLFHTKHHDAHLSVRCCVWFLKKKKNWSSAENFAFRLREILNSIKVKASLHKHE